MALPVACSALPSLILNACRPDLNSVRRCCTSDPSMSLLATAFKRPRIVAVRLGLELSTKLRLVPAGDTILGRIVWTLEQVAWILWADCFGRSSSQSEADDAGLERMGLVCTIF